MAKNAGGSLDRSAYNKHSFRVCWWNGGGAVRKRVSVNPGLSSLLKSKPDIFVYGESATPNARGLFLNGYRFLLHRSYLNNKDNYRRGMIIFYREKYHNIISKVYSSKTFDIVWIRLVTNENPLFFCFF